jgi:hypothetical protein
MMKSKIKYINRIQVIRDTSEPGLLAIRVAGIADLKSVLQPVLVPKDYKTEPDDGIFELDFKVEEGETGIEDVDLEVEVVIRLRNIPDWVKGIRINAEDNSDIELI